MPNVDGSNPERGGQANADGARAQALELVGVLLCLPIEELQRPRRR